MNSEYWISVLGFWKKLMGRDHSILGTVPKLKTFKVVSADLTCCSIQNNGHKFFFFESQPTILKLKKLKVGHQDVIITRKKPSQSTVSFISKVNAEYFTFVEVLFNVTNHYLYVPHRKLSPDEIFQLEKKYKSSSLHKISTYDPVVRHFRWGVGSIIEIMRRFDPHCQKYYRIVSNLSN